MGSHLHPNHRLGEPLPQRIAIVRSLPGLGDLLCVVPALRALRTALPQAHISLIGLPWTQQFVQRFNGYLNRCLEFPGFPGIPEVPVSPHHVVSFLAAAQRSRFDLVLQLHGNGSVMNGFTALLGGKRSAGFFAPGHPCPDPQRFIPYPEQEPEVRRHLRLMEFLGVPLQGEHLEFPLRQADWREFEILATQHDLHPGRYLCIHPGASVRSRCWSPQRFAIVADALATQGWQIVLTGTAAEAELTQAVASAMHHPAVNLAGKTSLGSIATLLKNSRLLICNDTGVSHLAAALQVSSVVVFSNSDPKRWAPLDRHRHRIVVSRNFNSTLEKFPPASLQFPTPSQVLSEAESLLNREVVYAS